MKKSDLKEFTSFLLAIAEVYGKKMSDASVVIYFEALKDCEFTDIRRGFKLHCEDPEEGRFMPLPAHIRGRICKPSKTGLIAWKQVMDAFCAYNYYDSVQFEDGVINAVIKDMGGWMWLSNQNLEEPWTQKEFERRYEAYKSQGIEVHERLPGFFELDNRARGYLEYVPDTKLISDGGHVTALPPHIPEELEGSEHMVKLLADKMAMDKP